ncbi:MAG TPA: DUF262 domain-containing protein [Burkholderiaceae bacterium]|nr:DUF262 domain-containing protein [Burkholderiaceae bacterium]
MGFEAVSENIRGLLSANKIYHIPRFQREFSWEVKNYKEILNDMLYQISVVKEGTPTLKTSQYFLGNMLFLGGKEKGEVAVIDGQQRLTTLTILLAAIRNKLYEIHADNRETAANKQLAKDYADTTQEFLIKRVDGVPKRIIQTSSTYPYFTQTIQDYDTRNPAAKPTTDEEDLLMEAFNFFLEQLSESKLKRLFIKNDSKHHIKYIEKLKVLRDQILQSQVIAIYASEKDQANQIFENINSKGKPLSKVDLIKNYIFTYVEPTSGGGVDEVKDLWKKNAKFLFDSNLTLEEFFLHYWKARFPEDKANANNLYDKFTTRYKSENPRITNELGNFVNEMYRAIFEYEKIIQPNLNKYKKQEHKYEYETLDSIAKFKGIQVRPALLSLYLREKEGNLKVDKKIKHSLLRFLSDFHFVAFGSGVNLRSNKVTEPCTAFSKEITVACSRTDIQNAIQNLKVKLRKLIDKEHFIQEFQRLEFSKSASRLGQSNFPTSYAIKRIAMSMDGRDYDDGNSSIEHIQNESQDEYTKNVGNLIVLETKLNNDLGNKTITNYSQKRVYYAKSQYEMTKEFAKKQKIFANEVAINVRAENLANQFWDIFAEE